LSPTNHQQAVVPYRGSVYSGMGLSDEEDYRLTLVALESCDAAYRQIQVWQQHSCAQYSITRSPAVAREDALQHFAQIIQAFIRYSMAGRGGL